MTFGDCLREDSLFTGMTGTISLRKTNWLIWPSEPCPRSDSPAKRHHLGRGRLSGLPFMRCLLTRKHRLAMLATVGYLQVTSRHRLLVWTLLSVRVVHLPGWSLCHTQCHIIDRGQILATFYSYFYALWDHLAQGKLTAWWSDSNPEWFHSK